MRAEATPFPMLRSPHATLVNQDSRITRTHASRGLSQLGGSTRSGRELSLLNQSWGSQAETHHRSLRSNSRSSAAHLPSGQSASGQSNATPRWTLAIFIIPLASTITFYALQYLSQGL